MKERGILFQAEMVRAILEGRKTQTRRALRIQPLDILPMNIHNEWATLQTRDHNHGNVIRCRFGVPGDRLWVREKWGVHRLDGIVIKEFPNVLYAADTSTRLVTTDKVWKYVEDKFRWRPSIFMPRWASRITLEIVNIRVERVGDISEADAIAEGIPPFLPSPSKIPIMQYATLWNRINQKSDFGWDVNPYVWVIEFKRCPI